MFIEKCAGRRSEAPSGARCYSKSDPNRLAQSVQIVYMHLSYTRRTSDEFQNTTFKNRAIGFLHRDMKTLIQDFTAEARRKDAEVGETIALSLGVPLRNLCASAVKNPILCPNVVRSGFSHPCTQRRSFEDLS
jgi:hypothetical protein